MKPSKYNADFVGSHYDSESGTNTFYNQKPDGRIRAGKPYYRSLTDCPKCKYGTVDRKVKGETAWFICADCGQAWTLEQWNQLPK